MITEDEGLNDEVAFATVLLTDHFGDRTLPVTPKVKQARN